MTRIFQRDKQFHSYQGDKGWDEKAPLRKGSYLDMVDGPKVARCNTSMKNRVWIPCTHIKTHALCSVTTAWRSRVTGKGWEFGSSRHRSFPAQWQPLPQKIKWNSAGQTGLLHMKEWNQVLISYPAQDWTLMHEGPQQETWQPGSGRGENMKYTSSYKHRERLSEQDSSSTGMKTNNWKVGYPETKKLLYNKGYYEASAGVATEREISLHMT